MVDGGYNNFIFFASAISYFVAKLCSSITFGRESYATKTTRMFLCINTYEMALQATKNNTTWWNNKVIKGLGVVTVLFALMHALLPQGFWPPNGYSQALIQQSYELEEDILIWTSAAYRELYARPQNSSVEEEIDMIRNSTIAEDPLPFIRGCATAFDVCRKIASRVNFGMIIYFLLILVAVLNLLTLPFNERIVKTMGTGRDNDEDSRKKLQDEREELWMQYRLLIDVSKSVNDIYDPLLKIMHVANLLAYANSMSQLVLEKNATGMELLLLGINLGKADLTYYMAGKIAERVSLTAKSRNNEHRKVVS